MNYRNLLKAALPVAAILSAAPAFAAPETYILDKGHTAVEFQIDHFGFSAPTGKFMNIDGTLVLDEETPANSKVEVVIPVTDINTGVPALDEHLKKPDFFDTENWPTATFTSTSVTLTGDDTAEVAGNLTIRDVTKPVTLNVKLNKIGQNFMQQKTAGFVATTEIKRSDFGISAYLPGLGDNVTLEIQSEANIAAAE